MNTLGHKVSVFFVGILAVLIAVLVGVSAWGYRHFSLYTAERHALSVAETIKVSLTESMINGTINKRASFLARIAAVPGVQQVRIYRGPAVIRQFGPGLAEEAPDPPVVERVFGGAKPVFDVIERRGETLFRASIPYVADDRGVPNCLQCHAVKTGDVLGAVVIDIPLTEVKQEGLFAIFAVSMAVLAAALFAWFTLRRLLAPLTETATAVQRVSERAVQGDFSDRIGRGTDDEIGDIARNLDRLMDFLEREVGAVRASVGQLMGESCNAGGNQLVHTTEMVERLVEVAHFKQAIEEDRDKNDIYRRLGDTLRDRYDLHRYAIYEVAASKNRMSLMVAEGADDAGTCPWCDPQILVDADACRARRTGHPVFGIDYPGLCTMFRPSYPGETHLCLPLNQSGATGCVVQIVVDEVTAPLARAMAPFIGVYLREAGPVLESKRLMAHLRESALRDAMTGLYNRRFLEEYTQTLVAGSQRRNSPFAVLMLDLDFFKQVNDTHGHEAGDKVIRTFADILQRNVRSSDLAVRYGGEEFLVVLVDADIEAALKVAEKIRAETEATKIPLPAGFLQKTVSIGVAGFPADSDSFWQVVKFADVALYRAKEAGRNRVVRFSADMWDQAADY